MTRSEELNARTIERLRMHTEAMEAAERPTVRVRIAVAVSDKGDWSSCGWKNCPNDKEAESMAFETLDHMGSQVVHFVEADVPLPLPRTVEAEVQP